MSAYMNTNTEVASFGTFLIRFLSCNSTFYGHRTRTLLNKVWPYDPWAPKYSHSQDSHLAWQVGRLCRLMLLMNRRAMWHRYTFGRTGDYRHDAPRWEYTRVAKLRNNRTKPTEQQLVEMAKFMGSVLYQCAEFSTEPRNYTLLCEFDQAITCDVFQSLKAWEDAPWGLFSSLLGN